MRCSCVRFISMLGMVTLALVVGKAASAQHYNVTDLGPATSTSSGVLGGVATAINNEGEVVGFAQGYANLGFVYQNGVTTLIGTSAAGRYDDLQDMATAVNDHGVVVYNDALTSPVYETLTIYQNGVLTSVNQPTNFLQTEGTGINNSGWIVGAAIKGAPSYNHIGFLYKSGLFSNLGNLGRPYCVPHAINDNGQVVGESGTSLTSSSRGAVHAFLFQLSSTGKVLSRKDLGAPPLGGSSVAYAINGSGQIVGSAYTLSNTGLHPFLWQNGQTIDLGLLPNETAGVAKSINASGQIVGGNYVLGDYTQTSNKAILYSNGTIQDLNSLISDSTWVLRWANGINDAGQIVGTGVHNGEQHAFLLTPQ